MLLLVFIHNPVSLKIYFKNSDKSSHLFVGTIHIRTYKGLLGIVSQDKNLFLLQLFPRGVQNFVGEGARGK
ncbi:hypothetical protein WN944_029437 [Citrus x changshan-huyou]|uniref:Uncharacterized protein n=1 Tax=Citrus x changshan-huyou TaxID=2935761 RepID=A0AAP0LPL8_9ROSI